MQKLRLTSCAVATFAIALGLSIVSVGLGYRTATAAVALDGIASGPFQSCAVVGAGQVKCWGGGLGSGEYVTRPANGPLPPGSVALQVAAGGDSGAGESCALLASGAVSCWGGPVRYPGGEPTYIPVTLPFGAGVVVTQISMGSEAGCAVIAGGGVKCWPLYWPSQIGNGSANPIGPVDVLLGLAANQVSVGWQHACATLVNGTVKCWGTIGNQAVLPDVGQAPLGPGAVVEQVAT